MKLLEENETPFRFNVRSIHTKGRFFE